MADKAPHKLGKYQILEEIGRGGFGAVYKAVDTTLERTVALKVLAPHLLWEPSFAERFRQEARTAANLRHPNIVVIYEVGEAEGSLFLAMEHLQGRTLGALIEERGQLALPEVARTTEQIASALDYAHARGLIHRDVKPSNIIVDEAGRVTLTDFGLVRAADGTQFTTTGHIMGTPEYMAPEQCEPRPGATFDHRVDVYALGIVVYQMVTGQVPFRAETPLSTLRGHVDQVPPPPSEANPAITPALEAILLKALAKSPDERYERTGAFAAALSVEIRRVIEEQEKAERLAMLHEQVRELLAAEEWARALAVCGQMLNLAPGAPDVGALLAQANEGLMRQRGQEEEEAEFKPLYEKAVALLKEGHLEEAIERFEQIVAVREDYRDAAELLTSSRRRWEEIEAEKRKRLEQLYTEATEAWQTVVKSVRAIKQLDTQYPDPAGVLEIVAEELLVVEEARGEATQQQMLCPKCGAWNPVDAVNCAECHINLAWARSEPSPDIAAATGEEVEWMPIFAVILMIVVFVIIVWASGQ